MEEKPLKSDMNRDAKGRFVPGNMANPNGRPRNGHTIAELLKQIGDHVSDWPRKDGSTETRTYREIAAERMWLIACYGQEAIAVKAYATIRDSTEGRPTERHEIANMGDKPFVNRVEIENESNRVFREVKYRNSETPPAPGAETSLG